MAGKSLLVWGNVTNAANIGNSTFAAIGGGIIFPGATGTQAVSIREAGTFSYMAHNRRTPGSGSSTTRLQVNGSNVTSVVTQSATGYLEDTTHTDTISANDTVQTAFTDGSTNPSYSLVKLVFGASSDTICYHIASGDVTNYDAASSTRFIKFAGQQVADGSTNEAQQQLKMRAAGTVESFQCNVTSNARVNTSTLNIRVNGSAVNGTLSIGAGVTGRIVDDSNTDTIAAGDLLCAGITLSTGVEDLNLGNVACMVRTTTGASDLWYEPENFVGRNASATANYMPVGGCWIIGNTSEGAASLKPGFNCTISNLRTYISSNSYSGSSTIKVMKNGSAVLTLTINAGATGWQENTSDSVSIAAGDTISYECVGGTTGALVFRHIGIKISDDAAVLTGTIAQTFSGFTESLTGAAGAAGVIAQTFSGFSQLLGAAQIITGSITQTLPLATQSLLGDVGGVVQSFTFSAFNNSNIVDWGESIYESYLTVNYFVPEDVITKFWTPYIYTFLKTDQDSVTDVNGDPVLDENEDTVISYPSLLMSSRWNWRENETEAVFDIAGSPVLDSDGDITLALSEADFIQVYRNRDGYKNSVAKNRIRGHGRTLQLKYKSEGAAWFELQGWGVFLTKNRKL